MIRTSTKRLLPPCTCLSRPAIPSTSKLAFPLPSRSFTASSSSTRLPLLTPTPRRHYSPTRHSKKTDPLLVNETLYPRDDYSNVTPTILSKLNRNLHLDPNHPLGILRTLIESHFSSFTHLNSLSPIVTVEQNFDDLGFPKDHPGRSLTDSYYLNRQHMLRTHTSAHEVESFRKGLDQFLLTADVYRRDEIDRSHYPVFHQVEGCNVVDPAKGGIERMKKENSEMSRILDRANIEIVDPTRELTSTNPYQDEHDPQVARIIAEHLKNSLNGLVLKLFEGLKGTEGGPLQVRWIEATFPWTAPSYEVEVMYNGKWLEILGCGVVRQDTLSRSGEFLRLSLSLGIRSALILRDRCRRTSQIRLGVRTGIRKDSNGLVLDSRHSFILVARRSFLFPIQGWIDLDFQTLLEIPRMLQRSGVLVAHE